MVVTVVVMARSALGAVVVMVFVLVNRLAHDVFLLVPVAALVLPPVLGAGRAVPCAQEARVVGVHCITQGGFEVDVLAHRLGRRGGARADRALDAALPAAQKQV